MRSEPGDSWTVDGVLELARSYQGAAVLVAAAELDLFSLLGSGPMTGDQLAQARQCDLRGLTTLLDALAALRLLEKSGAHYTLPSRLSEFLTPDGRQSVLAMLQHQANCLRNWAQLARVAQTGRVAEKIVSVRGQAGDQASFIWAMHNISAPNAAQVIQAIQPLQFQHLLDIGGASGTWTMAFLRAWPTGGATLFDLPQVIPLAGQRLTAEGFSHRVRLASGDFMEDVLPPGADLAWVSAIIHQNSRAQNRLLFGKVFNALVPAGRIAIRDVLMDETRTQPVMGALFAINMLVATEGGGTFTFEEVRQDLESVGFHQVTLAQRKDDMNSIVTARKPAPETAKP
jgi:hypothetical protein